MTTKSKRTRPSSTPPSRLSPPDASSVQQRREAGRACRERVPRSSHASWSVPAGRDPLAVLAASNIGRVPRLVPIRHGRMLASPFAFYRGAPAVMAHDLATTPTSGLRVQLCGDCHIGNFGLFASPERSLVFDLNDFDETLPGPFEWDIKRAAASVVVAARDAGIAADTGRLATLAMVRSYNECMADFAEAGHLEVWYSHTRANALLAMVEKRHRRESEGHLSRVQAKDRLRAFRKLTGEVEGERRLLDDPPLVIRLGKREAATREWLTELFSSYHASLEPSRQYLLSRYRLVDVAHKVVGVGSVGTRCFISFWLGVDDDDPLFLQVKEARTSLLEPYLGPSVAASHGQRVVDGQRLMQATGDIFLGSARSGGHDYFVRQLHDMKGSADLAAMPALYLPRYAALCGATLARAHARSGDAARIAGYLGSGPRFDEAIADFAEAYADQNAKDFASFREAVEDGRIEAEKPSAEAQPAAGRPAR